MAALLTSSTALEKCPLTRKNVYITFVLSNTALQYSDYGCMEKCLETIFSTSVQFALFGCIWVITGIKFLSKILVSKGQRKKIDVNLEKPKNLKK